MNRQEEIILHLESADQLIETRTRSPFLKRRLNEDAEKFIVKQATALPRDSDIKLSFYLPASETAGAQDIPEDFREHFAFRRDEAEKELERLRRFGWKSLLIGLVFLGVMMLFAEITKRYMPQGNFSSVLQEALTILGTVALWRPSELLLYEWIPFKRDAGLFEKLERADIKISAETKQTNE